MNIIKLTSASAERDKSIYINADKIGHFYRVAAKEEYGRTGIVNITKNAHTRVGVETHNNGGFEVVETPEQIIRLISASRAIK
jgi:hypothetical protein